MRTRLARGAVAARRPGPAGRLLRRPGAAGRPRRRRCPARGRAPPRRRGPRQGACYRLSFDAALAYTSAAAPRDCRREHTSVTYAVGDLDTGRRRSPGGGRLQAGEGAGGRGLSRPAGRVRRRLAHAATAEHAAGGVVHPHGRGVRRGRRLVPLRRDRGGRCRASSRRSTATLQGVLDTPDGRAKWGMCGTAAPGSADFERVLCSGPHSWRAVGVVTFDSERLPRRRGRRRPAARSSARTPATPPPTTRSTSSGATSGPPRPSGTRARRTASAGCLTRRARSPACAAVAGRAASPWRS